MRTPSSCALERVKVCKGLFLFDYETTGLKAGLH